MSTWTQRENMRARMHQQKGTKWSREGATSAYIDICENTGTQLILEIGFYAERIKPKLSAEEWRQYKRGYHWMAKAEGSPSFVNSSRFELVRTEDETGISGTGVVAEGVEWQDGSCSMRWLTKTASVAYYDSIEDVRTIHGHGGRTVVEFIDNPIADGEAAWLKSEAGKMCHKNRETWSDGMAEYSREDMDKVLRVVLPDISAFLGRWCFHWERLDSKAKEG